MPSDIIAGLVLLRQRQRAKRNAVLDEVGARPSSRRPPCNPLCPGLWLPPLLLLLLLLPGFHTPSWVPGGRPLMFALPLFLQPPLWLLLE